MAEPMKVGKTYRNFLLNAYVPKSAEENFVHTAKQAYIAFGAAIIAAAFEGVDATPWKVSVQKKWMKF